MLCRTCCRHRHTGVPLPLVLLRNRCDCMCETQYSLPRQPSKQPGCRRQHLSVPLHTETTGLWKPGMHSTPADNTSQGPCVGNSGERDTSQSVPQPARKAAHLKAAGLRAARHEAHLRGSASRLDHTCFNLLHHCCSRQRDMYAMQAAGVLTGLLRACLLHSSC
jgi:hypothetical protein